MKITVIRRDSIKEHDIDGFFTKDGFFVMELKDGGRRFLSDRLEINIPPKFEEIRIDDE